MTGREEAGGRGGEECYTREEGGGGQGKRLKILRKNIFTCLNVSSFA